MSAVYGNFYDEFRTAARLELQATGGALCVTGATAELTLVVTDEFRQELKDNGLAVPKPIKLTRTKPRVASD